MEKSAFGLQMLIAFCVRTKEGSFCGQIYWDNTGINKVKQFFFFFLAVGRFYALAWMQKKMGKKG